MRKLSKKISMLMVLAMLVGLFSGVVSASAASAWSFASSKYDVAVNGSINMESKEYADFDLLKDGKAPAGYTVAWASSDEDVVWVNAKTGQLRANKFGKAADGDKAVISATFTNTATKKSATRSFTIVLGAAKADFTVEADDVTIALGEEVKFAPVVKNADGKVVKFATHKSYNGYFLDGKAITNPWTPEEAGEYTVTVAQFAKKANVADLAKAVRKTEVKVTVTVDDFSAAATGVKEITVYGDFAKDAKFTVKKGTSAVDAAAKIAADGKSATLALGGKLTKGTYTVAYGEATADITVEDEKVASIVVLDDGKEVTTSADRKSLYVYYEVYNQYGESVKKNYSVDWTVSAGGTLVDSKSDGCITVSSTEEFIYGNKVIITGVHTAAGNSAVVNATVSVGLEKSVNSIEIVGVAKIGVNELTTLPANFRANDYRLLYQAYDQKGYPMDYSDALVGDNLSFTSKTPLLLNASLNKVAGGVTIDGVTYGAVSLVPGIQAAKGGVAEILVTSTKTGNPTDFELIIGAAQVLESFTLIAPDMIIAEGDGTVKIPYEAYDQDGKKVTDFRVLYKSVSLSDNALQIVEQDDGSAVVEYSVPDDAGATDKVDVPKVYTSTVINTGHVSTVTLQIKDFAVPTTIKELDATKKLIELGSLTIKNRVNDDNAHDVLKYYDQYDREMKNTRAYARFDGLAAAYKVYTSNAFDISVATGSPIYTSSNNAIALTGYHSFTTLTFTAGADVTAAQLGESVEFVLVNLNDVDSNLDDEVLSGSAKKETLTAVDITQCRSFSMHGDNLVKVGETDAYSVKGKLADGTELNVPGAYLSIAYTDTKGVDGASITVAGLNLTPAYSNADAFKDKSGKDASGNDLHRQQVYTAAIDVKVVTGSFANTKRDTVTMDITVDNVPVKVTDVKWKWYVANGGFTVKAEDGVIKYDALNSVDKAITNYGDEVAANVTITISKIVESENGLYSYVDADENTNGLEIKANVQSSNVEMLNTAEIGDTFLVSYAITGQNGEEGTVYRDLICTVGADKTAKFSSIIDLTYR